MRLREAGYEACCREALGDKRIGPFVSRLLAKRIDENGECGAAANEIQRLSIAAVVKTPLFTGISPKDLDREVTCVAAQKRNAALGTMPCGPYQRPSDSDAFQHRRFSRRYNVISEYLGCKRTTVPDLRVIDLHRTRMRRRLDDRNRRRAAWSICRSWRPTAFGDKFPIDCVHRQRAIRRHLSAYK